MTQEEIKMDEKNKEKINYIEEGVLIVATKENGIITIEEVTNLDELAVVKEAQRIINGYLKKQNTMTQEEKIKIVINKNIISKEGLAIPQGTEILCIGDIYIANIKHNGSTTGISLDKEFVDMNPLWFIEPDKRPDWDNSYIHLVNN